MAVLVPAPSPIRAAQITWPLVCCMAVAATAPGPLALPITSKNHQQYLRAISWGDGTLGSVCSALLARSLHVPGRKLPHGSKLVGVSTTDGAATFEWLVLATGESVPIRPFTVRPGDPAPARTFWIQCAAVPTRALADQMVDDLSMDLEEIPTIQEAHHPVEVARTTFRIRLGPFLTRSEALTRLKEISRAFTRHHLKPIVVASSS